MEIIQLEKQLKAVADKNRLLLLACMKKGEVCVCDFVEQLHISQPAVSQQLKKLKEAGIIKERKEGTWNYYRLAENPSPIIQNILDALESVDCQHGKSCSC